MGKQIKRTGICIVIMSLFLFLTLGIKAEASIKTGGVDVILKCLEEMEDGTRKPFERHPELMPGEQISYVLSLENLASEVWVRIHLSFDGMAEQDGEPVEPGDSWLVGIDESWVKRGEYWYYKKPLPRGSYVDFCQGICVPDIHNLPNGLTFQIEAKAEAVQAANMELDLESENPFSGMLIEEGVDNEMSAQQVFGVGVQYEGGAETILHSDGLFAEVEELMPGDCVQDVVTVKNIYSEDIQIRVKEDCDKEETILSKALRLTIQREGMTIYEGAFVDDALKNGLVIGTFSGHTEETLVFQLSLPREETNRTAFQKISANFVFSAEKKERERSEEINNKGEKPSYNAEKYPCPDPSITKGYRGGNWKLLDEETHKWEYYFSDGSKAKNGWFYLWNPYSRDEEKEHWFCFDEKGILQFGWIKTENGNWYFCHEISDGNLGQLKKGWHKDSDDGREYYLDPITGIMQTGWRKIEEDYYYFTPLEETKRQNWFWNTSIGRWLYDFLGYRTYGSMYKKEMTPDGYYVDENGVWNGEEQQDRSKM